MKRKIFSILFVVVLVLTMSLVTAMPVGAQSSYYVATDGSDSFGDGTETWVDTDTSLDWSSGDTGPWLTISYAISQASDTDTINVAAGTYAGAIVNKDVNIIGAVGGGSVITSGVGYKGDAFPFTGFRLDDGADGAEIRNFTMNGEFWFGVFARSADNVIVDSLSLNNMVQGITNWGGSGWEITRNEITETYPTSGGGIAIYLGADPTTFPNCDNNLVQGNIISTSAVQNPSFTGAAICLWFDERTYMEPTTQSMTGNEIKDNSITASGLENQTGIEIGVGGLDGDTEKVAACLAVIHDNTVQNNTIDNAEWGLYLYVTTNLTVSENTVKNCSDCGIYMKDDHANCLINYNDIYGNTNYGLNNTDGATYSTTVDATNNWWGSANGPEHAGNTFNVGAQGGKASDNVDYVPWLDAASPGGTSFAPVNSEDGDFSSIQAAIDAATGTTITCTAGIYTEVVLIQKSLTLQGGPGVVIRPDASTLKYDSFQGVGVDSARRAGIYIYQVDDVIVDGFEIDGTGTDVHYGIIGKYSDGSIIRNCVIHDIVNAIEAPISDVAGVGIMFWNEISGEWSGVHDAIIENNVVYETGRMGIFLGGYEGDWLLSSNNVVENNEVYDTWQGPTNGSGGAVTVMGVSGSLIQRNEIYNNTGIDQSGISILGLAPDTNLIVRNGIHDNYIGVEVLGGLVGVHYNNFCGNTVGLDNKDTGTVDATNNWWCHPSGPAASPGYGDPVSGDVLYDPWLLEPVVPGAPLPTTFDKTLTLLIGWTLVSTDNWIDPAETVGVDVVLAYNYTPSLGYFEVTPADLVPVNALYLKTEEGGALGIIYSGGVPVASSKNLEAGWNLISSATIDDARAILSPLRYIDVGEEQGVGLATLVSQGNYNLHSGSFYLSTVISLDWLTLGQIPLNPFDGYWVYMNDGKNFGVVPN